MISSHVAALSRDCHPERSLAKSEAIGQTQSKDPVPDESATSIARIFRIAVRFFDEFEAEHLPVSSRDATGCMNPAQTCRVGEENANEDGTRTTKHP